MLSHAFSIIIDRGISVKGHGREVVHGLKAIEKRFLLQLIPTVKLPCSKGCDRQMVIHTGTRVSDVSLDK